MRRISAKIILRVLLTLAFFTFTTVASAGAFQLLETDASTAGDFHAGGAADTTDVGKETFNPAILATIHKQQMSFGVATIAAQTIFRGRVQGSTNPTPVATPSNGIATQGVSFVPNFHWVLPLSQRFAFGFGITSMYGLSTDYSKSFGAPGILQAATLTKLITMNFSPSLAWLITKNVSIGAGVDVVQALANYNSLVTPIPGVSGAFKNSLRGLGAGYHIGVLVMFTPHTRIGISYRSRVNVDLSGQSTYTPNAILANSSTIASARLPLPSLAIFSVYHDFSKRLAAMFSAFYTGWSAFSTLTLNNTALGQIIPAGTIVVPQNYHDSWTFALGTHYWLTHTLMWKLGFAYDETPTKRGFRDMRLPDSDRYYFATGIHILTSKKSTLDIGYVHVFFTKGFVNNAQSSAQGGGTAPVTLGTASASADVLGLQFTTDISA